MFPEYAQKMLDWRMKNAERMLTHLMVSDCQLAVSGWILVMSCVCYQMCILNCTVVSQARPHL